jgi:hypothetical protein
VVDIASTVAALVREFRCYEGPTATAHHLHHTRRHSGEGGRCLGALHRVVAIPPAVVLAILTATVQAVTGAGVALRVVGRTQLDPRVAAVRRASSGCLTMLVGSDGATAGDTVAATDEVSAGNEIFDGNRAHIISVSC